MTAAVSVSYACLMNLKDLEAFLVFTSSVYLFSLQYSFTLVQTLELLRKRITFFVLKLLVLPKLGYLHCSKFFYPLLVKYQCMLYTGLSYFIQYSIYSLAQPLNSTLAHKFLCDPYSINANGIIAYLIMGCQHVHGADLNDVINSCFYRTAWDYTLHVCTIYAPV